MDCKSSAIYASFKVAGKSSSRSSPRKSLSDVTSESRILLAKIIVIVCSIVGRSIVIPIKLPTIAVMKKSRSSDHRTIVPLRLNSLSSFRTHYTAWVIFSDSSFRCERTLDV